MVAKQEGMTDKKRYSEKKGIVKRQSARAQQSTWFALVNHLKNNELLPCVIFAFSKKVCEDCAFALFNLDLTTGSEKSEITVFFNQALLRLQPQDRKLPQVLRLKALIKRGIGVHHAGNNNTVMLFNPVIFYVILCYCTTYSLSLSPCVPMYMPCCDV